MRFGRVFMLTFYSCFVVSFAYENLSSSKKATQSSRNNDTTASPTRAVDGEITTCSSTGADNPAWWYVDLEEIKNIHDIRVFFNGTDTADEQRQRELMYGYQLYVSNTTDLNSLDSMHHCYNDSGPALPDLISNHVCTTFGRYVIFYNERIPGVTYPSSNGVFKNFTYVQLCELIVNGCDHPGTYGDYCVKRCPSNCQERRCHIINGTCLGCTEGWKGDKCEYPCPEGYYGLECRGICSNNCKEKRTCNHETGNCDNGCSDGWTGGRCNITCSMGTYGSGCSQNCSGNCKNDTSCNRVTGFCDSGCTPGYTSERCDQVYTQETFVTDCFEKCSIYCLNRTASCIGQHCDQDKKEQDSDVSGTTAGLASVLGISLLLNGAFIVFLLYWFKRKTPLKSNYENRELSEQRTTGQETQLETSVYQELQHENQPTQTYQNLSYNS